MIPPFILSLAVHEWAHAWTANKLGDPTAKLQGRLTLNPIVHMSWIGTVIFPAIAIYNGGAFFGWAKPVPVDTKFFKYPRRYLAIVAAAGPASNVVLAVALSLLFRILVGFYDPAAEASVLKSGLLMAQFAVHVNVFLFLFNLIPVPPLDGSKILQGMLPRMLALKFNNVMNSEMAFWIFLLLMIKGAFGFIAQPAFYLIGLLEHYVMGIAS